jgi:YesN/AraC family two-component response regulator
MDLLGYQPLVAPNGSEGLACLEKEQVDLVIADIKMPVMDGIEMMKRVREKYPELHVILTSGYQPDSSLDHLIDSGVSGYITKPFNLNMVEKKVRSLMDRRVRQKRDRNVQ